MRIAITVDVEKDIGFMDSCYGIDEGLPFILDILRKNGIKATFFVSGQAVDCLRRKGLFKRMVNDSHEIASHGYTHTDYRGWVYENLKQEISRSKQILEEYTGNIVRGYRAPQFLLDETVVRAVKECGFSYDSSLPDISGISAAKILRQVKTSSSLLATIGESSLEEFSIDSLPIVRLPHGLLWINLISIGIYKVLFNFIERDFLMFYMHPFDLVKRKNRVQFDLKRKLFYLRNQNGIAELVDNLIQFWISRGIIFVKLEDEWQERRQK